MKLCDINRRCPVFSRHIVGLHT